MLHFGHSNIIAYSNRPYGTDDERAMWNDKINPVPQARKAEIVHAMNEDIVATWNATVDQYDFVYIIGDVSFTNAERTEALLSRLNGIKILVYGNHDKVVRENTAVRKLFAETHEFLERDFKIEGQKARKIVMCHYAMRTWNKSHHGSWALHGHSHGTLSPIGLQMDVGVDTNNMRLYSLEDVARYMKNRQIATEDHHIEPR